MHCASRRRFPKPGRESEGGYASIASAENSVVAATTQR
jgi:hypothetical protein